VEIDPDHLTNGSIQNPDGAGVAYADGSNIVIEKGFFDGAETVGKLMKELVSLPVLIHFRWSTQGNIDKSNCHPFSVGDWAMVHNGVIPAMPNDKTRSDTFLYVKRTLKQRMRGCKDWPLLPNSSAKMAGEIGHSKLAFLRGNGDVVIVNEGLGEWVDGCWYSNDGYKEHVWHFLSTEPRAPKFGGRHRDYWHSYGDVPKRAEEVAPIGEYDTLDYRPDRTDGFGDADLCAWCDKAIEESANVNGQYLCEKCMTELEDEAQHHGYSNPHDYVSEVW
jgi:glutamine amidotransferase